MSTEFFNDQWRIPSNENQNKISNYSMEFNGSSDFIDCGDSDKFSFTNGATDRPFSLSAWIKPNSLVRFKLFGKFDTNNSNYEYQFGTSNSKNLVLSLYNQNTADRIQRYYNNPLTSLGWQHWVATYDGSGDPDNIKIYINGVQVGDTSITVGTYTAMQNTAAPLLIASESVNYANGKVDQATVFDYELSPIQVASLGLDGYAFNFNGSTQAIDCGTGSRFDIDQITISGWVNLSNSITSTQIIAGIRNTNNGFICYHLQNSGATSKFRFVIVQEDGTYADAVANDIHQYNTWYHVVGVADGSNVKLYVNGVPQTDTGTYDGTIKSPNANFNIGRQPSNPLYYWDGELSNISVFNTGLQESDVQTLYNSGKPLTDMSSFTSLQGWWKLDDTATFNSSTSVWTIPDNSSNSNNGTSVGPMTSSSLVASDINGELIANPMITSPKPIAYYQLGDQSVDNGANYLVPNNSLSDYVFNFVASNSNTISVNSTPTLTGDASLSLWVKASTNPSFGGILSSKNYSNIASSFSLQNRSGDIYFIVYTDASSNFVIGNFTPSTALIDNWNHIAVVIDTTATTAKVYFNASLALTVNLPSSSIDISDISNGFAIGAYGLNSALPANLGFFDGEMSNAQIFNTALTATGSNSVETLYNNGSPLTSMSGFTSLVAWYKLNAADTFDGADWTITDYGSGSNDGTSSGMDSSNLVVSDLQQTSGYSPYALDFDSINDYLDCGGANDFSFTNGSGTDLPFSLSAWINMVDASGFRIITKYGTGTDVEWFLYTTGSDILRFRIYDKNNASYKGRGYGTPLTSYQNKWINVVATYNGNEQESGIKLYINGLRVDDQPASNGTYQGMVTTTNPVTIGKMGTVYANGKISNASIFNTELTSTQVTEIYNEGLPSNLNNFSGTAPVSWWQIGSNSSYNSGAWTCLDEIGTNNAVSAGGMTNDDITNGPGYSASGLGTSSIDIIGDAPYSTANGLSENMDVLDRVSGTGNVPG